MGMHTSHKPHPVGLVSIMICMVALLFACHTEPSDHISLPIVSPVVIQPQTPDQRSLADPDAVIQSQSLLALPGELLHIPLLHAVLTEDFLFPYADSEDWLGLQGSLRRIVFEHHLQLADHILDQLLRQPATVFLWCDRWGALRHYVITIEHPVLAHLATLLASVVAAKDTQFTQMESITINGEVTPVYQLTLSPRRTFMLIFYKNRLSLWSDDHFLTAAPTHPGTMPTIARWLSAPQGTQPATFAGSPLLPAQSEQTLLLNARFLSQGYSEFFPGIHALRFDENHGQWRTQALISSSDLAAQPVNTRLWQDAPAQAAFCVLAPGHWSALIEQVPASLNAPVHAAADLLSHHLQPSALSCWYPHTPLYAPLLMARLTSPADDLRQPLQTVFNWAVNVHRERSQKILDPAISLSTQGQTLVMQRKVPVVDTQKNPTLAITGDHLSFSVDAHRVHQAIAVASFLFPAQSDLLAANAQTLAYVDPTALAQLIGDELKATVPTDSEQLDVLEQRIDPRLAAMAHFPPFSMQLASTSLQPGTQWYDLQWRTTAP